jgi:4-hydroxybenzoate polyprenyltransferase
MTKWRLLWRLGRPWGMGLCAFVAGLGSALSPLFLSPDFPPTRLAGVLPTVFSPRAWSLWHALGAALVAGLIWSGTALIGEVAGRAAERSGSALLRWGLGLQAAAFALVLVEGSREALLVALVGAGAANVCAMLPLRRRQSGPAAHFMAGAGVTGALVGGMLSQAGVTQVGLISAVGLGVLAATMAVVRDFADVDGDRAAGLRTLATVLGVRAGALVAMAAATAAWLVTVIMLLQRVGMQEGLIAALALLLALHLFMLSRLLGGADPAHARRAPLLACAIFLGVTTLYVAAQALY